MKLKELILKNSWKSVWGTGIFVSHYHESQNVERNYRNVYRFLRSTKPGKTEMQIWLTESYDDIDERMNVYVHGIKSGDTAEKPEFWGIEFDNWGEWLDMEIRNDIKRPITEPEIIAHCLYELTFYGWYPGESAPVIEDADRRARLLNRNERQDYDAFLCHASEDKVVAREIERYLSQMHLRIWFDELDLKIGSSLRQEIDRALAKSRFGIVLLSKAFFEKGWTNYELDGLTSKQMEIGRVIFPIWHQINRSDILKYSPSLANIVAISTDVHPRTISFRLKEAFDAAKMTDLIARCKTLIEAKMYVAAIKLYRTETLATLQTAMQVLGLSWMLEDT